MKTKLPLLLLFFFCQILRAETIINIPDNGLYKGIIANKVDKNNDGLIQESEAKSVISLNVSYRYILNMTGIEAFTSLKFLDISYLDLDSIYLNKNNSLEELRCHRNHFVKLDLSENPLLTLLECSSNRLTSLKTENLVNLTHLDCNFNMITSLDLTKNTLLTKLLIDQNKLSTIDVSQNTLLTSFGCDYNNISEIDITNNVHLISFFCDFLPITELDLSKNLALVQLGVDSTRLQKLDIRNCPINYINALDNDELTKICITEKQLSEIDIEWHKDKKTTWSTDCELVTSFKLNEEIEEKDDITEIFDGLGRKVSDKQTMGMFIYRYQSGKTKKVMILN